MQSTHDRLRITFSSGEPGASGRATDTQVTITDYDQIYDPLYALAATKSVLRMTLWIGEKNPLNLSILPSTAPIMSDGFALTVGWQYTQPQQYYKVKNAFAGRDANVTTSVNDCFIFCTENAEIIGGNASVFIVGSNAEISCGEYCVVVAGPGSRITTMPGTVLLLGENSVVTINTQRGRQAVIGSKEYVAGVAIEAEDGTPGMVVNMTDDEIASAIYNLPLSVLETPTTEKGKHYLKRKRRVLV